ncbi:hypothetical protein COCON_G00186790 [Conger conger]|uniref:Fibronectin type-III domain-containing protein n=1 Tax=Conger conger TaxID=82655 RepID=A0A9Q1D319_CONCO|nr:hypothetical protein COCON_G00186790 [Conger conger]
MAYSSWTFTVILLYSLWRHTASQEPQSPNNVTVVIQDGEVSLVWTPPASLEAYYKVQIKKYSGCKNWTTVPGCERVRTPRCDLTSLTNSLDIYWCRVKMIKKEMTSKWTIRRFNIMNDGGLLSPTFTLSSSSTSVKVRVHRKPALVATYKRGLDYTYYLREKEQDIMDSIMGLQVNKTRHWEADNAEEEDVEFDYLTWGQEYCVRLDVKHTSGTAASPASSEQCVLLPRPDWYIAAILLAISLSSLGVLGLLTLLLHCFLWRPKPLPSTLKCPSNVQGPLILGEVLVEKVTDQGWFLLSRNRSKELGWNQKAKETDEGETRRGSTDSGVSVEQPPSERAGGGEQGEARKREDSGCGSLQETDSGSSGGSRRMSGKRPLLEGRNSGGDSPQMEDSGLSLGCGIQYNGSGSLQGEDCGHLPVEGVEAGDGYRSQRPSFVVVQDFEREKPGERTTAETDSSTKIPVGYRSGLFTCVCRGEGLCLRCQSLAPLPAKEHSKYSYPTAHHSDQFPASSITRGPGSYLTKSHPHNGGDLAGRDMPFVCHVPQTESSESIPLLISVPQLPLLCGGLDGGVNAPSFSLQDVELTFG